MKREEMIVWVCDQWHEEVAVRPLVNVNRRTLDDTWRKVLRYLGADDVKLLGPAHDDLLLASRTHDDLLTRETTR